MNPKFITILRFIAESRSIILIIALCNFILIWTVARQRAMWGITCAGCPWYFPWYWDNEPTQLLISAVVLRLNRVLGSVVALFITGHLLWNIVWYFAFYPDGFHYHWLFIRRITSEPFEVLSSHGQYVFALIIFCCSVIYLTKTTRSLTPPRRPADNNAWSGLAGERPLFVVAWASRSSVTLGCSSGLGIEGIQHLEKQMMKRYLMYVSASLLTFAFGFSLFHLRLIKQRNEVSSAPLRVIVSQANSTDSPQYRTITIKNVSGRVVRGYSLGHTCNCRSWDSDERSYPEGVSYMNP